MIQNNRPQLLFSITRRQNISQFKYRRKILGFIILSLPLFILSCGPTLTPEQILEQVVSENDKLHKRAVKAIKKLTPEQKKLLTPKLFEKLRVGNPQTEKIRTAVATIGKPALPFLKKEVLDGTDIYYVESAFEVIVDVSNEIGEAKEFLIETSLSEDVENRARALETMEKNRGKISRKHLPLLINGIMNDQFLIRYNALKLFMMLDPDEAEEAVGPMALYVKTEADRIRRLPDSQKEYDLYKDPTKIEAVIGALGILGHGAANAAPVLVEIIGDKKLPRKGLRDSAILALGKIGEVNDEVIPALGEIAKGDDDHLKEAAFFSLQTMGTPYAKMEMDQALIALGKKKKKEK